MFLFHKKHKSNLTKTLVGVIGLLVVVIALLMYKINTVKTAPTITQTNPILSATSPLSPEMVSHAPNGIEVFRHTELEYSVEIPDGWTPRMYRSLAGSAVQPYNDVIFLSPNYAQTASDISTPIIANGASIFIRGAETSYSNTLDRFNNNPIAKRVAQDVTQITIAGTPGLEYDYSINGENVTIATFVKDNISYLIKYQYANEEEKNRFWTAFEEVRSSLKPTK